MVPHVAEHKSRCKYELVTVQSCVELLSTRLQGFTLIADYDPFAPADDVKHIHGIAEARKRARENTFAIAKRAKRRKWTPESEEVYRMAFAKAGSEREFDKEVLNRDIQGADAQAFEQSELDEGLSMTLPKVHKTDQTIAESQHLTNNIDHQDIGPSKDGKVEEFHEWITLDKKDTESVTERPEDNFARTLTYLRKAIRFGKQAYDYRKILKLLENSPESSPTFLNSIITQVIVDYANLSQFYTNAFQNGQAADQTHVGEQQEGSIGEEKVG